MNILVDKGGREMATEEIVCEFCEQPIGVKEIHPSHPTRFRCYHKMCWEEYLAIERSKQQSLDFDIKEIDIGGMPWECFMQMATNL